MLVWTQHRTGPNGERWWWKHSFVYTQRRLGNVNDGDESMIMMSLSCKTNVGCRMCVRACVCACACVSVSVSV